MKIEKIIILTCINLIPLCPNIDNCFELFGYDFMIDEDFNLWLIECNTNPSIAESAKYLE
jgi:hypothetical protein